jgi:anti-sigma B factor antagonist
VSTNPVTSYELEERVTEALGLVVVETSGELDLTNAADLERRLQALTEGGDIGLVLDLNRVLFIDSAALHVLFRTARRLGKERLGLVVEPGGAIARTFAIVGISQVATVAASHDELPPPLASPD